MQLVRIGQDHPASSTKRGNNGSRKEQHLTFVFVDLLKAESEALANQKKFVLSVGTTRKLGRDNGKEFLSEQYKLYWVDAGILREKLYQRRLNRTG